MQKPIRFIFKVFLGVPGLVILYLAGVIAIGTFTDYKPENVTNLNIEGITTSEIDSDSDSSITFLSWNIGFCGLGAEMDFFYDGGEMVRPTPGNIEKYTNGVLASLKSSDSIDFILLQEVDKNSARTRRQDETELIKLALPEYSSSFGINYNVQFVPLPFTNPLGKVEMGQMNFSKYKTLSAQRYSFFSAYAWPKRLFMLDRCFVVSRFKLENGKELLVMNTHNSAYDTGGKLREQEMPVIRDLMLKEYKKGNYVVAGGDWNQNPPEYKTEELDPSNNGVYREKLSADIFPDGWQIVYDPDKPTNREIDAPYQKEKTEVTIIDYFILSPNVQIEKIKTLSQNFAFSDHEPVFLKIRLNKPI